MPNSVARPGLNPGTLGALFQSMGPSLTMQIHWSNGEGRSPEFSEILPGLNSWLRMARHGLVLRNSHCSL